MNLKLEDAEYELDRTEIVIASQRGIKLIATSQWDDGGQWRMIFAVGHREHNYSVKPTTDLFDRLKDAVDHFNQLVDRSQERVLD